MQNFSYTKVEACDFKYILSMICGRKTQSRGLEHDCMSEDTMAQEDLRVTFLLAVVGFEKRVLCLLSKCSTTCTLLPAFRMTFEMLSGTSMHCMVFSFEEVKKYPEQGWAYSPHFCASVQAVLAWSMMAPHEHLFLSKATIYPPQLMIGLYPNKGIAN
jgi:hypothetical protein